MKTYAYGFPRIGKNREYKKTLEALWANHSTEEEFISSLHGIEDERVFLYSAVDMHPDCEISFYDPFIDTAFMMGILPFENLDSYYSYCRGNNALPMKKYFNTNYHYMRPEINNTDFSFAWDKFEYLKTTQTSLLPVVGPFTLLKLSHVTIPLQDCIAPLAKAYAGLFKKYPDSFFHVEEPAFVLELTPLEIDIAEQLYTALGKYLKRIHCITYYEAMDAPQLLGIGFRAWGLDFVAGRSNLEKLSFLNKESILIAGLIDGRNVFPKNDDVIQSSLGAIMTAIDNEVWISNAAPLSHLPFSIENEPDKNIASRFVFAKEKLGEIREYKSREKNSRTANTGTTAFPAVGLYSIPLVDRTPYEQRKEDQKWLGLPLFPTTTIGSYPQTADVRKMRNSFRNNEISEAEYGDFINKKITAVVRQQEEMGYDVLVHGEFERTDMVEYFAEKLEGIYTTQNGWIISYGSRGYRPPIIEGNVKRPTPMTVKEIAFAQSLTKKPMKGMLTGPVTIIAWSFTNPNVPVEKLAHEIADALQEEVKDYINAGIKVIQIDEPAFREKAPIKRADWPAYFDWAVKAFKVAAYAPSDVQIHTHMCYSDFDEIIAEIEKMDADVISVEASRSRGEIIKAFESYKYKRQIGLGVWDIHSPVTPTVEAMKEVVTRSIAQIPAENFWVNPDCGLKTRKWEEIETPLRQIIDVAGDLREQR
ncbi:MAG: 5-methyltetrahydropteroyltriglutamate--homocysteine S-methyltransferase [Spirochaetales bacterium]|nr:5-methyltetrahydropteroyltriglutamate--homocysteine S-methyltransferase [Spirochaetales bacterium]